MKVLSKDEFVKKVLDERAQKKKLKQAIETEYKMESIIRREKRERNHR